LVEHGRTAWLVPPDDPGAMSAALQTVLTDSALRTRLREAGLELAHSCSWDAVKLQWVQCYEQLSMTRGQAA
jgi:glycosyltransferase involved in cell wall biosynthesis